MIREQEEKCWSVTAVRDGELEENPVTTEYARVEEGLTPPREPPLLILLSVIALASSPPTRPLFQRTSQGDPQRRPELNLIWILKKGKKLLLAARKWSQ